MKAWKKIVALLMSVPLVFALSACEALTFDRANSVKRALETRDVDVMTNITEADSTPFYVLVIGNDSRAGTVEEGSATYADGSARSDTMMLVRVDPNTYQLTVVSIPRDTAVMSDAGGQKINNYYSWYGIEGLTKEVYALTGIEPKYYLDTNFVQFENLVNALGGCTIDIPIEMSLQDIVGGEYITLQEGEQTLNGAQTLVAARQRKQYAYDQDECRQILDRQILINLIMQVAQNPEGVRQAVDDLLANTETNWPKDKLFSMVLDFALHKDQITVYTGSGPGDGDIDAVSGIWLATRDEAKWAEIMDIVDAGGDPSVLFVQPIIERAQ